MPPRRKERSLSPYFTPSGQGKLFYEPADGLQQKRQREQTSRRREFEGVFKGITEHEVTDRDLFGDRSDDLDKIADRAAPGDDFEARLRTGVSARTAADLARGVSESVPIEDVQGLSEINVSRSQRDDSDTGVYSPEHSSIWLDADDDHKTSVLVHEIGHHVSTRTPGYTDRISDLAQIPSGPVAMPREEAFADSYAAKRGHRKGVGYFDTAVISSLNRSSRGDFGRKYLDERRKLDGPPPSVRPFARQLELF